MITVEVVVRDDTGRVLDPAGLGVAELVSLAGRTPPGVLDARRTGGSVDSLRTVEQALRQVAAVRVACVAALGDTAGGGWSSEQQDRVCDELMTCFVVSRRSALFTSHQAEVLRSQPAVWAAVAAGLIDLTRGVILADALLEIPRFDDDGAERATWPKERAQLLELALPYAQEHTARRLSLFLRRHLAALGRPDRDRVRRRGRDERGVWIAHDGQGNAEITARLSSHDAEAVYATIRAVALADRNGDPAHTRPGCPTPSEPLDAWLAGAFVDTILGAGTTTHRPGHSPESESAGPADGTRPGVDTVINVTIPIESLAGLTDQPGVLNGYGVIPADIARRLAGGDTRWRHILTCRTSGAVLDVGTLSYRPPTALARHVRLRDGTCRFPGCAVPARECDLDHLIPFPQGPTSAGNLHALCRRHHGLKHDDGWTVEAVEAGERHGLRWTSPHGATATTYPDDTLASVA